MNKKIQILIDKYSHYNDFVESDTISYDMIDKISKKLKLKDTDIVSYLLDMKYERIPHFSSFAKPKSLKEETTITPEFKQLIKTGSVMNNTLHLINEYKIYFHNSEYNFNIKDLKQGLLELNKELEKTIKILPKLI